MAMWQEKPQNTDNDEHQKRFCNNHTIHLIGTIVSQKSVTEAKELQKLCKSESEDFLLFDASRGLVQESYEKDHITA